MAPPNFWWAETADERAMPFSDYLSGWPGRHARADDPLFADAIGDT